MALVLGTVIFNAISDRKRKEALKRFALRYGFNYQEERKGVEGVFHRALPLSIRGRKPKVTNLLTTSEAGYELSVFDYRFTQSSGQQAHVCHQTVALFHAPKKDLPGFTLGPQYFFHWLGRLVGVRDIDFPSNSEFSKAYLLQGEDEEAVRKTFNVGILNFFRSRSGWTVEGLGNELAVYRFKKRAKVRKFREFLTETRQIFELFRS